MPPTRLALPCLVSLALVFDGCTSPEVPASDRVLVSELPDRFEVTVPKSCLVLSIPKGDRHPSTAQERGATASPRYFMLSGSSTGSVISGWFEPASQVTDLRASWQEEMQGIKRNGYGAPKDVTEIEVNGMRTILHSIPVPTGSSAHSRSSQVRAGTWIDLHVSVTGNQSESQARAQ